MIKESKNDFDAVLNDLGCAMGNKFSHEMPPDPCEVPRITHSDYVRTGRSHMAGFALECVSEPIESFLNYDL